MRRAVQYEVPRMIVERTAAIVGPYSAAQHALDAAELMTAPAFFRVGSDLVVFDAVRRLRASQEDTQ